MLAEPRLPGPGRHWVPVSPTGRGRVRGGARQPGLGAAERPGGSAGAGAGSSNLQPEPARIIIMPLAWGQVEPDSGVMV